LSKPLEDVVSHDLAMILTVLERKSRSMVIKNADATVNQAVRLIERKRSGSSRRRSLENLIAEVSPASSARHVHQSTPGQVGER
jgi:hypothetical protein